MKKTARLAGKKDFKTVFTDGRAWANNFVVIKTLPNDSVVSRFAFVAGKRLGNAVVRNRVKRRLREATRGVAVKEGWDVIVVARQPSVEADYHTLKKATQDLFVRARLLGEGGNTE
jgi:ribonuclease P protein component